MNSSWVAVQTLGILPLYQAMTSSGEIFSTHLSATALPSPFVARNDPSQPGVGLCHIRYPPLAPPACPSIGTRRGLTAFLPSTAGSSGHTHQGLHGKRGSGKNPHHLPTSTLSAFYPLLLPSSHQVLRNGPAGLATVFIDRHF